MTVRPCPLSPHRATSLWAHRDDEKVRCVLTEDLQYNYLRSPLLRGVDKGRHMIKMMI